MANVKLLRPRRVKLLATVHKLNVNLFLDLNYLCVSICVWVNRKIGPNRMQTLQNRQKSQNQHHFVTELMYNTLQFNIHLSFHSSIYVVGNQDGPSTLPPLKGTHLRRRSSLAWPRTVWWAISGRPLARSQYMREEDRERRSTEKGGNPLFCCLRLILTLKTVRCGCEAFVND